MMATVGAAVAGFFWNFGKMAAMDLYTKMRTAKAIEKAKAQRREKQNKEHD